MNSDQLEESMTQVHNALKKLDDLFVAMEATEINLTAVLSRLEQEEIKLREAIQLVSESGVERLKRQRMAQDQEAIQRLEAALLNESSTDDDNDSSPHC